MSAKTKFIGVLALVALAKPAALLAQNQNVPQQYAEKKYVVMRDNPPKLDGQDVFYTGIARNVLGLGGEGFTKVVTDDEEDGNVFRSNNGVVIFLPHNYGVLCAVVKNGKLEHVAADNVNAISCGSVVDPQYAEMIEYINKRIVKYILRDTEIYKAIVGDEDFMERKDALRTVKQGFEQGR